MKNVKAALFLYLILSVTSLCGQERDKSWVKWEWLIGDWAGEGQGQPGQGNGKFTFEFGLDNAVLIRKASASYPAANNRAAIMHTDLMIIYRNEAGLPDKAVYFDNENHVINYSVQFTENSIVFLSEKTPGKPVFRLTYTLVSANTVNVKFEMSADGANFKTYVEGKSVKQNSLDNK